MGCLAYDLKVPEIDETVFVSNADWKEFYGDAEEEMPRRAPEPRGNPVNMSAFVDATRHCKQESLYTFAMLQSFSTVNGRIQLRQRCLAVSLLHCAFAKS